MMVKARPRPLSSGNEPVSTWMRVRVRVRVGVRVKVRVRVRVRVWSEDEGAGEE